MPNRKPIAFSPDLTLRQCPKCGDDKMTSHERQMDFLRVKSVFECPNCQHKTILDASGATGVHLAIGILATAMLSYILWGSSEGYKGASIIKTLALLALFTAPVWLAAIKARKYMVTGVRPETLEETPEEKIVLISEAGSNDPFQKGVARMALSG